MKIYSCIDEILDDKILEYNNLYSVLQIQKLVRSLALASENCVKENVDQRTLNSITIELEKYVLNCFRKYTKTEASLEYYKDYYVEYTPKEFRKMLRNYIIRIVREYDKLRDIVKYVEETIGLDRYKEASLNDKDLFKQLDQKRIHHTVMGFGDNLVVFNGILKLSMLIYLNSNVKEEDLDEQALIWMLDDFFPKSLVNYINKLSAMQINVYDDCIVNSCGDNLYIVFSFYGNALNPVYIVPLNGGEVGFQINYTSNDQLDGCYTFIIKQIFNTEIEIKKPERSVYYHAYSMLEESVELPISNMLLKLKKKGLNIGKYDLEVNPLKGTHIGMQMLANAILYSMNMPYGVTPEVMNDMSVEYLKTKSFTYLINLTSVEYKKQFLETYLKNTFRFLSRIIQVRRLLTRDVDFVDKVNFEDYTVITNKVWKGKCLSKDSSFNDRMDWILYCSLYFEEIKYSEDMFFKGVIMLNYLFYSGINYLNLIAPFVNCSEVKVTNVNYTEGVIKGVMSGENCVIHFEKYIYGYNFPVRDCIKLDGNDLSRLPTDLQDIFVQLNIYNTVTKLEPLDDDVNSMFSIPESCVVYNPDDYSFFYLDKETKQDNYKIKYYQPEEMVFELLENTRSGNEHIKVYMQEKTWDLFLDGESDYYTLLEDKQQVFLENIGDDKTYIFD